MALGGSLPQINLSVQAICVPLISRHRRECLQWACQHDTERVINGWLFSLRISPGLASKVIGDIFLGGCTDLHVFSHGNLNTHTYRDDILDAYVRPCAGSIGESFVLQDDNARPHRDAYLEQETIQRIKWPARSSDLNPIEHV
ncbi:DDE_3 domain-containing protein [Trichonephila clavipes]|nr:DDE_3 domain-containing protein [Trichonephila clavipes]